MNKQKALETLDGRSCGLEETCIGLRHGNQQLSRDSAEYIRGACEEIIEALDYLEKINEIRD